GFDMFQQQVVIDARTTETPGVARSRSVLADADAVYAFGGVADGVELDTIVRLNPMAAIDQLALLALPMGAPRTGHTATTVSASQVAHILVFGGEHAEGALAEEFVPGTAPRLDKPGGDPGPPRWDHAAVLLPRNQVLIVGGRNATGALGDSVI